MIDLDTALLTVLSKSERANDHKVHMSEAGRCARAIWYRLHDEPVSDPIGLSTLISFAIGTHLGEKLAEAWMSEYPHSAAEQVLEDGALAGRFDVAYRDDAGYHIVEFKTANPFSWKYLSEPKREHILQASLYARACGGVTDITIVYCNTSTKAGDSPFRMFTLPYDLSLADAEHARLSAVAAAADLPDPHTGEVELDPLAVKAPWQCNYCSYRSTCEQVPF